MSKIHAEFGGSAPFSHYVRGGAYVPDGLAENSSIATVASSLKMSQFLGARAADLTPNGLPWNASYTGFTSITIPNQTISGLDAGVSVSLSSVVTGAATATIYKNNVSVGSGSTFQNGDLIRVDLFNFGPTSGTLTIRNTSDGNATVGFTNYTIN